ncbi:MAG: alpha/beta hydrolase [Reyranellaceae bacterium]
MAVRVYFATNRCPDDAANPTRFADTICAQDPQNIRFGWAEVDGAKSAVKSVAIAAEANVHDPENQVLGSDETFDRLRQDMIDDPADLLFFVHGFANSFDSALVKAAQLRKFYGGTAKHGKKLHVMAFSWPSDGKLVAPGNAYRSDYLDAEISGVAIGRVFLKAARFVSELPRDQWCGRRIHVLAHSMGNWALLNALQHVRREAPAVSARMIDQVVLAAADAPNDAFESDDKLRSLGGLAARVTVYMHPQDLALHISSTLKGNSDRLGKTGPRDPALLPANVAVINVWNAAPIDPNVDTEYTTHQYYRHNKLVRNDIVSVLHGLTDDAIANRQWRTEKRWYALGDGKA